MDFGPSPFCCPPVCDMIERLHRKQLYLNLIEILSKGHINMIHNAYFFDKISMKRVKTFIAIKLIKIYR